MVFGHPEDLQDRMATLPQVQTATARMEWGPLHGHNHEVLQEDLHRQDRGTALARLQEMATVLRLVAGDFLHVRAHLADHKMA